MWHDGSALETDEGNHLHSFDVCSLSVKERGASDLTDLFPEVCQQPLEQVFKKQTQQSSSQL